MGDIKITAGGSRAIRYRQIHHKYFRSGQHVALSPSARSSVYYGKPTMILAAFWLMATAALSYFIIHKFVLSALFVPDLGNKPVLITGCGGGFGKALVIRCLRHGMTVFAGCRRAVSVDELRLECRGLAGTLYAFQMDVANDESVAAAKAFVEAKLTQSGCGLFALVNNAGIRGTHMYDDLLTMDDYKSVWETNTFGCIRVTRAFKPLLKRARGRVVICGSSCTLFTIPSYGPYATSKAAVSAYADVIRQAVDYFKYCQQHELAPFGVKVILIVPGSFESGMQDTNRLLRMLQEKWDSCEETVRKEYGEHFINRAKTFVVQFQERGISKDVKWVEDTYFHAVAAKYPKPSYRIGWDTILFFHPYSLLPLQIQIAVMGLILWIVAAPVPAAARTSPEP
ncbi:Retinol dehydrogenase 16 [Toxocara canis]|uniref:Retinol dehydrogenase 16 n=1 Tax=Toxocara canis TaxID=6265 RepID=A0A0B2VG89_TOXCA|nr:Retinol dehydrogenase 16 [Toxocara canis]